MSETSEEVSGKLKNMRLEKHWKIRKWNWLENDSYNTTSEEQVENLEIQVKKWRERRIIVYAGYSSREFDLEIKIIKSKCGEKDARRKWSRELTRIESEGKMKNEKELNICVQSGQPKEQNEENKRNWW